MKALTLWQPWASLVAAGLKPYEFRTWPAPQSLVGERIAIHAGKRTFAQEDIPDLLDDERRRVSSPGLIVKSGIMDDAQRFLATEGTDLPLGTVLAVATLARPVQIDPDMWAWPLTDVKAFDRPQPARGAQGFWDWEWTPEGHQT